MTEVNLNERVTDLLMDLGLIRHKSQIQSVKPLTGGVASDVALVETGQHKYCAKFALPKMRVEADWFAPVYRNKCEYEWLQLAEAIIPENTPKMFGFSKKFGGFAMDYVGGDDCFVWKEKLFKFPPDISIAEKVGKTFGKVQSHTGESTFNSSEFLKKDVFFHMRIEPYILYTGSKHPNLKPIFDGAAKQLADANKTLVHGDVSPKNILVKSGEPILIDAECATMGEPAFDVAFCLNHFFLKAVFSPQFKNGLEEAAFRFFECYNEFVHWEDKQDFSRRVAKFLPMLGLARVDGKSPVEYLNPDQQEGVRQIVIPLILSPQNSIQSTINAQFSGIR
ncbi:MAG: aminoglycoside phosphotransferase family protein [Rhodobacteraceae bacterium]|nr:aminoglycoside phosphotransferase family protein [Paracoccaceae bacterium]MYG10403.1 aminoglycoside phosphotransferase family protein [Paracoccaceae bacterium]